MKTLALITLFGSYVLTAPLVIVVSIILISYFSIKSKIEFGEFDTVELTRAYIMGMAEEHHRIMQRIDEL